MGLPVSAAPMTGRYENPDVGSDFLSGRWSEGFVGGYPNGGGNGGRAASWDGLTLGGQWGLDGATLLSSVMVLDTTGGKFRLDGAAGVPPTRPGP
jgi:hypothetical protein